MRSIVSKGEPNTARKLEARKTDRNFRCTALRSGVNDNFRDYREVYGTQSASFRVFRSVVCRGLAELFFLGSWWFYLIVLTNTTHTTNRLARCGCRKRLFGRNQKVVEPIQIFRAVELDLNATGGTGLGRDDPDLSSKAPA